MKGQSGIEVLTIFGVMTLLFTIAFYYYTTSTSSFNKQKNVEVALNLISKIKTTTSYLSPLADNSSIEVNVYIPGGLSDFMIYKNYISFKVYNSDVYEKVSMPVEGTFPIREGSYTLIFKKEGGKVKVKVRGKYSEIKIYNLPSSLNPSTTSLSFNTQLWSLEEKLSEEKNLTCKIYSYNLKNYVNQSSCTLNESNNYTCQFSFPYDSSYGSVSINCKDEEDNIVGIRYVNFLSYIPVFPIWRNCFSNVTSLGYKQAILLSCQGKDESGLWKAILITNETGSFEEKNSYGSPITYNNQSNVWLYSNFTWKNSSAINKVTGFNTIGWRVKFINNISNYNTSKLSTFKIYDNINPSLSNFKGKNIKFGDYSNITSKIYDEINLTTASLYSNESGSWNKVNEKFFGISNSLIHYNFSCRNLSLPPESIIKLGLKVKDSYGNVNESNTTIKVLSNNATIAYYQSSLYYARYRTYLGNSFSSEKNALTGNTRPYWIRLENFNNNLVLAQAGYYYYRISMQIFNSSTQSWQNLFNDYAGGRYYYGRFFDIATFNNTPYVCYTYYNDYKKIKCSYFDGSWHYFISPQITGNRITWMKMKAGKKHIMILAQDYSYDLYAILLDPKTGTFKDKILLTNNVYYYRYRPFDVAYLNGKFYVFYGIRYNNYLQYKIYDENKGKWTYSSQLSKAIDTEIAWVVAKEDKINGKIAIATLDNNRDINLFIYNGSFYFLNEIETNTDTYARKCFDLAFNNNGDLLIAWSHYNVDRIYLKFYYSNNTFSPTFQGLSGTTDGQWIEVRSDYIMNKFLIAILDDGSDINVEELVNYKLRDIFEVETSSTYAYEAFDLAFFNYWNKNWYDYRFANRRKIIIENKDSRGWDNVQVKLLIPKYENLKTSSIIFTEEVNGKEEKVNFFIRKENSTHFEVWLKVPYLPSGNNTLYLYYNNLTWVNVKSYESFKDTFTKDSTEGKATDDDNLILELHFDEGTGSKTKDDSPNEFTGTLYNTLWIAEDGGFFGLNESINASYYNFFNGYHLYFDGTSSYVTIPDNPVLSPQDDDGITVCAWVKVLRVATDSHGQPREPIVAKGYYGQWEYALYVYDWKVFGFSLWQCGGSSHTEISGHENFEFNKWYFVCGTYKYKSFNKLYVNGKLDTSSTSYYGNPCDGNRPLQIGRREDGQYLNAYIDEVKIFNRALKEKEIEALYERRKFYYRSSYNYFIGNEESY